MFLTQHFLGRAAFSTTYLSVDLLQSLLQLLVVIEIARKTLPSRHQFSKQARKRFGVVAGIGLLMALAITFFLVPPTTDGAHLSVLSFDIFSAMITCEFVIALTLAANSLGIPFRSHLIAIGQGLAAWALSAVATVGLYAFLGNDHPFASSLIPIARVAVYLTTATYWCVRLWHEEPARNPISPALRKYMVALHDQVNYDLGKVGH